MQDRTAPAETPGQLDGRAARALRTHAAIVDACVSLVEEGELRPTAPRIAERAGVSVRSVFQHFDDLPSLHLAVSRRVAERVAARHHPIDVTLPLGERIGAFARQRSELLDLLTPFLRAAQVHGPFSPEIRHAVNEGNLALRQEVEQVFVPELAGSVGEPGGLADAVAAAASWGVWDSVRHEWGRSADEARAVMARTLRALLGGASDGG